MKKFAAKIPEKKALLGMGRTLVSFVSLVSLPVFTGTGAQPLPRAVECPNRCDISPNIDVPAGIILACDRLSCSDNGNLILNDISLQVRQEDSVVLSGPKGAGKTTLFRLVTDKLFLSLGELWLGGRHLHAKNRNNALRYVGIISQDPHDQLLCTYDQEDIASAPKDLSLPFHSNEGYAFIVVTHDINLAFFNTKRIIILNKGRIAADGYPWQILTDQDIFAAARMAVPILTKLLREILPELADTRPCPSLSQKLSASGAF